MNSSALIINALLAAQMTLSSAASAASEHSYGLYMLSETVRSVEKISKDHDFEETFLVTEANATGCGVSDNLSVYHYIANTYRSNVKKNVIEFCTIAKLSVGNLYSGYFQGKTDKGLPVLPADAIFISYPDGYFRLPSYQVHTIDCDGKTILLGGVRALNLPKAKDPSKIK